MAPKKKVAPKKVARPVKIAPDTTECDTALARVAVLEQAVHGEIATLQGYLELGMGRGEITPMIARLEALVSPETTS